MTAYEALKTLHILGTVLIFGTGIGTAFFLLMAYRTGDLDAIRVTTRHVVIADWLFTAPAVIAQPITGALLMRMLGMRADSVWFATVAALYVLTGLCWIPVVAIQYRLRNLASSARAYDALPSAFHRLMRWWIVLGVPAFAAVMAIVVLMVTHTGANMAFLGRS
jgi:uncharacterized membrane protein